MPVVTSIKQQKNKNRVNIYLDGKFGIGLDLDNFVKLNLKVEQRLTGREIEEIKSTADFAKIYNNLLRFVTLRPRSEKEVKDWLRRMKVPENFYKRLFFRLKRLELVGDEKFARWWVDSRLQFKSKSKRELLYELRGKGISKEIIDQVISEASMDELKIAKELIGKKEYKWRRLDKLEKKKKMTEFLARHGFTWEVIRKVFDLTEDE